jgi:polar amino acid transport system permease protein
MASSQPSLFLLLSHWSPALLQGFGVNILISVLAISMGTIAGLVVGFLKISRSRWLRLPASVYVQIFRNAPMLVLIYFSTYVFPFELHIGHGYYPFPDWVKVTLGLTLPASAYVAEIFRGALQSIPSAQWESAHSLAFSRGQILRWILLPQCVKRMLPPWINLYSAITMSTSLATLVGVHDLVNVAQIAANTVNRIPFTVLSYFTVLMLFFVYCYPISRYTRLLEKRHAYR